MRHLKKHYKIVAKQVKGLNSDIEKANAKIERNRGKIDKLYEQIHQIQSKNLLISLDIKAAEQLRDKLSSI